MKALRSSASAMARRICGLSKGGAAELTARLVLTSVGLSSQMAFGAPARTSFISGTVMSRSKVMSNSPDTNARMRVERLSMMRISMASTYGLPFFQ